MVCVCVCVCVCHVCCVCMYVCCVVCVWSRVVRMCVVEEKTVPIGHITCLSEPCALDELLVLEVRREEDHMWPRGCHHYLRSR